MPNPNQPNKPKSTEDILREMEEMSGNEGKAEASAGGSALKSLLGFFVKVSDDEEAPAPVKMPVPPPSAPPQQAPRVGPRVGDLLANEPAPKIAPMPAQPVGVNLAEEPFEEIYKAAGLPPSQCSVDDLAKLLENPTIANQPMAVKVVAVNLTLSAKNLTAEEPIADALRRDRALDAYQAMLAERVVNTEQRNSAKIQQISQEVAEMDALKAEVAEAKKQSVEFAIRREIEEKRMADLITPFLEGKPNPVTIGNTPEIKAPQ
jgi:hypothetical protein